jgi:long-chain acyl-CoA synthetase
MNPDTTAPAIATHPATPWPVLTLAQAHAAMTAPGQPFEMAEALIDGQTMRVWKNAPATLRDVFVNSRAAFGAQTFLVYEGERATFEAFARATLAFAEQLAAMGVVKGDRVGVAMRNLPEWPVAVLATLLLGGIATPINAWGTGPELAYCLADSGAKVAVVDGERWDRLQPLLAELPALLQVVVARPITALDSPAPGAASAATPRVRSWDSLIGPTAGWSALPDRPLPVVDLSPDDDATLLYTSGTTGAAKGALGTHRCSGNTLMGSAFSVARSFVRRGEPLPDPAARSVQRALLLAIPFFHTTGCQVILFGALQSGTKLVLMHRWEPEAAMALIQAERITSAGGVPTIAWQLIEHPARAHYDLSSLESVSYGGAPASAALVQRIGEAFPKAQPGTGWGMTETSGTFTHHGAEDYVHRPDSAGPAMPVAEMKIADDEGQSLPLIGKTTEVGELWVRGPNVVKRYWNKPEETAATFVAGWLRTGDLARLDDEGFLTIVDRKKDMLIRGGENIYCAEVEAVLYRHPAVMDAGVVGQAHPTLGEEPVALVTLKPDAVATEAELRAFVRSHIAGFKVPVRVVISGEPLPRNPTGKLMKKTLKLLFETLA